ncbi:MAG: hypothetical protein ICV78_04745 [Tolypothrix sp. Co-bin9]|nr:hypothetical protein [Tolypothrix sp. Co-bin9]
MASYWRWRSRFDVNDMSEAQTIRQVSLTNTSLYRFHLKVHSKTVV